MSDSYTETTSKGWFSRIGESIKGILVGLVLIPIAIVALWWNEGQTLTTAKSLEEGQAAVVEVAPDKVDPANDKKLVHVTGEVNAAEAVLDPVYGISLPALRLARKEEIFQWVESKKTETKEKLGGSEETTTTYTYNKEWADEPVDSSEFKKSAEHPNKGELISGTESINAQDVTLGAFQLPDSFVSLLEDTIPYPVTKADLEKLEPELRETAKIQGGAFFFGAKPEAPEIGDHRVSFELVKPGTFSLVAAQLGDTFEPYQTTAGNALSMIEPGTVSSKAMFQKAASTNKIIAWVIRIGGFLFMWIGFAVMMRPLSVLGSVVPFIGNIIGVGTGFIAFALAGTISIVVIAMAWLFVRPLLGITLLVLAVGGFIYTRRLAAKSTAKAAA